MRILIVILGDQLDRNSSVFDDFDASLDHIWMAEVREESTHVWSHKARTALFLSAMRHFAEELKQKGYSLTYLRFGEHAFASLDLALAAMIASENPDRIVLTRPGDYRVREKLKSVCAGSNTLYAERTDTHFYCTADDFGDWVRGRKEFRLEHFYRMLRKREDILMAADKPEGGDWNYDAENRGSFGVQGPGYVPTPKAFPPDQITADVLALVEREFAAHPGTLVHFDWPVTPEQAEAALADFIAHRLCAFGLYQDAMWQNEPYLFHSKISAALNLKLISPRTVINAAVAAYRTGKAPLAAVEGFVRQILGWREYVRGLYWWRMPSYTSENALQAEQPLPGFYWTGDTDMACLKDAIGQTLKYGYAHHIQRLMVTGLFALMLGVRPKAIHEWYLAVYVDAVEWVELPNVLGMSQYADGGVMASKPYCASGKYIQRMSNYCQGCKFKPDLAVGADACPFTTLYWDFLAQHKARFAKHPRAALQWRSLERLKPAQLALIRAQATDLRARLAAAGEYAGDSTKI
jgi:deoxyribodipyrimidine photolyase-related protein